MRDTGTAEEEVDAMGSSCSWGPGRTAAAHRHGSLPAEP
ncbi:hypothetical protein STXM2123_4731 [Streptomyces sp. F-3]|nr:hypothetical protein STXM2123_4731 [Streptomyces sp. F-3]